MTKRSSPKHSSKYYRRSAPAQRIPSFAELPDRLTWAEAQHYLCLGKEAFANRLKRGDIPFTRFGRAYRIAKESLRPTSGGTR